MTNTSATEGVCAACRYGSECIFEAAASRPILQCEQFELALPIPPVRAKSTETRSLTAELPRNGHLGLCMNCEFRDACIYPRPEGGVWRCEEYR